MQTEVLIVGAGPTGLSLAAQFVRYGINFIIIDLKDGVTELSKAIAVHARTLEIYDQLGLARKAVENGAIVSQVAMLNEGQIRAEINFSDIGENLSPFPFVLALEQSKNEHLLEEFLKANGKEVLWKTEIEGLSQDASGVTATIKNASDEISPVHAKYIVGCDGAGSRVRHLLNIGFEGETDARLFYVADVEMESGLRHEVLHVVFGSDAFALFFPMRGENHWRLIGNLPEFKENETEEFKYEEIEKKVKDLAQIPLDITKVKWFSTYKIHTRRAEKFSVGRAFLAGDAAHIHTPAGGQGMNTGIQDAYNLAWKIAFVLRLNADESLLETYNEERLENAERLLRTTDEMFEFGTGEEWYFKFFRERILPGFAKFAMQFKSAKQFIFPLISQIGISYEKDVLSRHSPTEIFKVKAGNRFPYFTADGKSIYEFLAGAKCHLIIFSDGSFDLTKIAAEINDKFSSFVDVKILPLYPQFAELFGASKTFSVFIRPDNHIGFITAENPLEKLSLYLSENLKIK
jgi:2-polyprenyl-6-methoxyphenol hydroxylase-like FAD-dependent oxidoreductase